MCRALVLIVSLVLAGIACSSTSASKSGVADTAIDWESCGQIECATFAVPLDYSNPSGETIDLSLIRIKARRPELRVGVLMANPGGPGASANDFVRIWRGVLASDIRDRFDIVSFDPRGVGESSPVVCHDNLQALIAADPDPDTDAEWEAAKAESKKFADACAAKYRDVLPYLGTKNVARDMDRIRETLGEATLNYIGYSYGTSIGAVYADMFPSHIRSMVLDGGTNLALSFQDVNRTQMIGFERAFDAYLADCRAKNCAIAPNGSDPRTTVNAIIAAAEKSPIPAKGADRPAGPGEVQLGILSAMYSKFTWSSLTRALQDAAAGDGTGLVRLTDSYLQRDGNDGDYPNLIEANAAVNYADTECPKDPEAYRALGEQFAKDAPTFGRSAATSGLTCAYWATKPDPVDAPKGKGAPPIVVVSTTNDPATPYEWGKALSQQLESGVLVTHRGEGHTIYAQGNACIDSVVNAYILTLAVPAIGTSCGNGPPPPGESASPSASSTPPSEATSGVTATATVPAHTPSAPATGGGRDNGSAGAALWAAALVLGALAAAGLVVLVVRRR